MSHPVFFLEASMVVPHWLASLWVILFSPGWSFFCHGVQVTGVPEKVPHLKGRNVKWFNVTVVFHYSFLFKKLVVF